jgi:hypothetical protein
VKEPFEELLWWMSLGRLLEIAGRRPANGDAILALEAALEDRMNAAQQAGYRVEGLLEERR